MSLKNTKNELVRSVVSLALCGALLTGGTLAYFTKTVESKGNTITTSKFDVQLLDENGQVIEGSIFNNTTFKPGDSITKTIKIKNNGELDFNYAINIVPEDNEGNEVSEDLQKVIKVKIDNDNEEVPSLYKLLTNGEEDDFKSSLKADEKEVEHSITIEMPKGEYEADKYSGKSVGNFTIEVRADEKEKTASK